MEAKELTISIPEGYEIDKEKSTFEKIVFKEKDTKPRSLKEYVDLQRKNAAVGYVICEDSTIEKRDFKSAILYERWKNVLPSKELAEAFIAMMQLMAWRQWWIGDWEPNWSNRRFDKYCIIWNDIYKFVVTPCAINHASLSFPTQELAKEFMNTFKDLLETAKPLI